MILQNLITNFENFYHINVKYVIILFNKIQSIVKNVIDVLTNLIIIASGLIIALALQTIKNSSNAALDLFSIWALQ